MTYQKLHVSGVTMCAMTYLHTPRQCAMLKAVQGHEAFASVGKETQSNEIHVCCSVLQRVAVWCGVLQCVAVCCSVLQCVARQADSDTRTDTPTDRHTHRQTDTATRCNALQRTATHCNILQHTATHRKTHSQIDGHVGTAKGRSGAQCDVRLLRTYDARIQYYMRVS